ncbi:FtsX-like permease family protein [Streptomyces sp. NBC_01808]|uniref:FtsX-like permease family protein n=1 Tax=Streptomyces sp. NBC_01808 TaxID=2975947 RepID=UPI002DDC67CB|nr:FtsX-like permease family protein [Streptomyces sp. NBC_01808]WSA37830.1 FtsX-like permease family protein [Streptomyces sp. NBC_01808]
MSGGLPGAGVRARTNGLARAALRFRPAGFAGTFVALMMAALIVSACGILLETGVRASVPPERYAQAPVVVAADQRAHMTVGSGDDAYDASEQVPDRARVRAELAERVASAPGVAAAVPDVTFPARLAAGEGAPDGPALTAQGWGSHAFTGTALTAGSAPGADEVVLDRATARAAGADVGDTVALVLPSGQQEFRVSGIAAAASAQTSGAAYLADDAAARAAGHPGRFDAVAVLAAEGAGAGQLADAVRGAVGDRAEVHTGDGRGGVEDTGVAAAEELLTGLGGSFGGIAATVAVFTAAGTVALSVAQRKREFALLRAIGATPRQIRRSVAAEALLVAPVAGLAGLLPGIGLASWWFGQLKDRGAVPAAVDLHVSPIPLAVAVGTALLSALVAGWAAARRPARTKPGQALTEASVERLRPGIVRTVLGLGAVTGGILLSGVAARSAGDDAAEAALGVVMLFMLAVALLGPLIARLAAGLFGLPLRAGDASAELAAANSRTNARRLASAITPIVLATAFASVLVFMHTSEDHATAAQQRAGVTADHVVTHPDGLPADAAERAARQPGVDAAVGVLRSEVLVPVGGGGDRWLQGATAQGVYCDGLTRVQDLDVRDGALDRLPEPGTVALDENLARSAGAGVGERVELRLPDGTSEKAEVVATYGRGLGLAQVTLDRAALTGHVTAGYDTDLLVSGGRAADLGALGGAGTAVTDAAGYAQQQDVDRSLNRWANFTMAGVLGGFAAVAALNTLVMTVLDRRRELGMLRLIGSTRRQVLGMIRWEGLLVGVAGLVLGGAIAAATLVPMVRGITGGDPYLPPLTVAAFTAGAVGLGLLGTVLPARAALRRAEPAG